MSSIESEKLNRLVTKGRLEALSDAVFAVAMTLLVLNLMIPTISGTSINTELIQRIFELWPKFFAYLLSFLLSGVAWIQHRFLLHHLRGIDNKVIWISIIGLMFIVLLPFSTSLLGEYWQYQIPHTVFGANFLALLLISWGLMSYGKKSKLLTISFTQKHMKFRRSVDACIMTFIIISVGLSYLNTIVSFSLFGAFILFTVISTFMGLHERGIIEEE